MELSLHFSTTFQAHVGATAQSLTPARRSDHHKRRERRPLNRQQRLRRTNIVSFAAHRDAGLTSDEDDAAEDPIFEPEPELGDEDEDNRGPDEPGDVTVTESIPNQTMSLSIISYTDAGMIEGGDDKDMGFTAHMDKISGELDGLVAYVKRHVESLAEDSGGDTSRGAGARGGVDRAVEPIFAMLAFTLEDWDI